MVVLNQSHDENRAKDEIIYPDDNGKIHSGLFEAKVVNLLFRESRCPVWIDINIAGTDQNVTLVELSCCGRYHGDRSRMYYGNQPFGIKSPLLPPDWKEGEKFQLLSPSKAIEEIITRNSLIFKDSVKVIGPGPLSRKQAAG